MENDAKPLETCKNCGDTFVNHKIVKVEEWSDTYDNQPRQVVVVKICPTAIWKP